MWGNSHTLLVGMGWGFIKGKCYMETKILFSLVED